MSNAQLEMIFYRHTFTKYLYLFLSSVVHIAVVHLGFSEHSYQVIESMSFMNVCFELMDGALTGRPIVLKAFSTDGSAVGM
jgi:hypothetical protein